MTQRDREAPPEAYVSVDVEAAGPNPGQYSLLSIGACLVADIQRTFYVELRPVNHSSTPQALAVSGLSLEELAERGLPPAEAMARFETWLEVQMPSGWQPIFVAFNAPFDWMFVNDYVQPADCLSLPGAEPLRPRRPGPEGFFLSTGGLTGVHWSETRMRYVAACYLSNRKLTHHALRDAQDQAELFQKMLAEAAVSG